MIYFAVALLVVAIMAVAVGVSSIIIVVRIGDDDSRAVWGGELTQANAQQGLI